MVEQSLHSIKSLLILKDISYCWNDRINFMHYSSKNCSSESWSEVRFDLLLAEACCTLACLLCRPAFPRGRHNSFSSIDLCVCFSIDSKTFGPDMSLQKKSKDNMVVKLIVYKAHIFQCLTTEHIKIILKRLTFP